MWTDAEASFDLSLRWNPDNGAIWYCLADARERLGRFKDAAIAYESAIRNLSVSGRAQDEPGHSVCPGRKREEGREIIARGIGSESDEPRSPWIICRFFVNAMPIQPDSPLTDPSA